MRHGPPPPLPRSGRPCACALLVLLLLCCSAAAAPANRAPAVTIVPVNVLTTAPTPVPTTVTAPVPATTVQTMTCTAPYECLLPAEAAAKWGTNGYVMGPPAACEIGPASAAAPTTKYCYRPVAVATATATATQPPVAVLTATMPLQEIATIPPVSCPGSQTLCPGGCTDTATDGKNCGSCGNACPFAETCSAGSCQKPAAQQAKTADYCLVTGKTNCGGTCIDTQGSDSRNCGGCGWTCPAGLSCSQGACVKLCPAGLDDCQYDCVDLQTDPGHCGSCGASCGPRQTCWKGGCMDLCSVNPDTLPSFSWSDRQGQNWLTSVKSQGACGSCWAESSTGVTEAVYNLESGYQRNLDLSEQAFVSGCFGDLGSCLGGDHTQVLSFLKSAGAAEEGVLPYASSSCGIHEYPPGSKANVCNADCNNNDPDLHCSLPHTCSMGALAPDHLWKIQSYQKDTDENPWTADDEFHAIKQAILCHGPLDVCSGHWWHCVTLAGWQGGTYTPGGGWIIKNSWGATWNGNGYAVVPYGNPWSKDVNDTGDLVLDAWSVKGVYRYG